jgi:flagellar biosynthesis protein FlhB
MIIMLVLEFTLLLMMSALGNVSWSIYQQTQKMPEDKVLQINNGNTEFTNHVGMDWLVALLAITASILALAASNRIVYRLSNKHTKIDWRDEYK